MQDRAVIGRLGEWENLYSQPFFGYYCLVFSEMFVFLLKL